jgi:hypothetical protein
MNNFNDDRLRDYFDNILLNGMFGDDSCPDEPIPPSTSDINLYDLMGDDYYPYLSKDVNGDYTLTVEDFDNKIIAEDVQINPCAIDGFAEFCRRYLASYDRLNKK